VKPTLHRNPTQRLRSAVDALPGATKQAMLDGIASNRIIVGAYVDPNSGGICPMLEAHRNGGRTSLASIARAWDTYTCARRPRLARRREVRTLTSLLETSLAADVIGPGASGSLVEAADRIRDERAVIAQRLPAPQEEIRPEAAPIEAPEVEPTIRRRLSTGERHRAAELRTRLRWAWMRPTRRYDDFKDLVAAAEEQLSEARAADELGAHPAEHAR
jgi:hypothetical protein